MNILTGLIISPMRGTPRLIPVLVIILASSLAASSQTPPASKVDEMRKLDFLLGEWKGKGQEVYWDGSHGDEFSQKTKVQAKAGGLALRIQDARNYKTPSSSDTSTLDATIYYDERAKIYRWRGENSYGRENPLEAALIDVRTFQFGVPFTVKMLLPNGARRTTIKVTESGEWNETLEVWKIDRWYKVEESILRKVK
jgi:hypothetical protein